VVAAAGSVGKVGSALAFQLFHRPTQRIPSYLTPRIALVAEHATLILLHLYPESAVPHISLVLREMWDTTALPL
jgi:hypothetical protein